MGSDGRTPDEATKESPSLPQAGCDEPAGYPRAEEWEALGELVRETQAHLLPLPLPTRPLRGTRNPSSRLRQRARRARGVWRSGVRALMLLNSLMRGRVGMTTENRACDHGK